MNRNIAVYVAVALNLSNAEVSSQHSTSEQAEAALAEYEKQGFSRVGVYAFADPANIPN